MSREDPQMKIRLPQELKEKILLSAGENNRSMNAEIVLRLESSFPETVLGDELPSPEEARKKADQAKENFKHYARKRVIETINEYISTGNHEAFLSIEDINISDTMDVDLVHQTLRAIALEIAKKGYDVVETDLGDYMISF